MRQYSTPQSPMSCTTPSGFCTTPSSAWSRSLARKAAFTRKSASSRKAASSAGFTMVEMIAVVLILSLLMGVSSAAISGARRTAYRTHSLDTVRQLVSAWQTYLMDQGKFPDRSKFHDKAGDIFVASPYNIGALLNTQYFNNKKGEFDISKPVPNSIVYFETSEKEVERSGSSGNYSYNGTGIIDRWKNQIYFTLDFDLEGTVENPVTGKKVTGSALAMSSAGKKFNEIKKYGSKFLVAW